MSVSFQARADDVFQTLDYPSKKKKTVSIYELFLDFTTNILYLLENWLILQVLAS